MSILGASGQHVWRSCQFLEHADNGQAEERDGANLICVSQAGSVASGTPAPPLPPRASSRCAAGAVGVGRAGSAFEAVRHAGWGPWPGVGARGGSWPCCFWHRGGVEGGRSAAMHAPQPAPPPGFGSAGTNRRASEGRSAVRVGCRFHRRAGSCASSRETPGPRSALPRHPGPRSPALLSHPCHPRGHGPLPPHPVCPRPREG